MRYGDTPLIRILPLILAISLLSCASGEGLQEPEADRSVTDVTEPAEIRPERPDWFEEESLRFSSEGSLISGYSSLPASDPGPVRSVLREEAVLDLRHRIDGMLEELRSGATSERTSLDEPGFIHSLRLAVSRLALEPESERVETLPGGESVELSYYRMDVPASEVKRQLESALADRYPSAWRQLAEREPLSSW